MTEAPSEHTPSSSSSSSSSSFPGLLENETELTIPHFWRSTKPRQCVRSEIRVFQGVQFRLLVWPQGSKQTNPNYLSAFVEVVPGGGGGSPTWPSDWLIPSVSYRISIMNHKQKWIYAKADTWSFSYVCPDRGWHTLLDTRYVNRRDGYLSPDGSLTIRASVLPRFSVPTSVLPFSSLSPSAGGGLGQEHLVALVSLLHGIPGFKRLVFALSTTPSLTAGATTSASSKTSATADSLLAMERELDQICQDLRSLMETVTAKKSTSSSGVSTADPSAQTSSSSSSSLTLRLYRSSGAETAQESLRSRHQKSLVVCDQLAEVIDEISRASLSFVTTAEAAAVAAAAAGAPATVQTCSQQPAWRATLAEIRGRLQFGDVFKTLFHAPVPGGAAGAAPGGVLGGLQRAFGLLDVVRAGPRRWKLLEKTCLGISRSLRFLGSDVFSSPATPEHMFAMVLRSLRAELADDAARGRLDEMFAGSLASDAAVAGATGAEGGEFEHVTLNNGRSTNVDKVLGSGKQTLSGERNLVLSAAETVSHTGGSSAGTGGSEATSRKLERKPKILWMTVANKIKDRLDVNESVEISGEKYRLHGLIVGHGGNGSDSSYAGNFQHYSVLMRRGRKAPWTRVDENELALIESQKIPAASGGHPIAWVFSPEFPVAALLWVRESEEDLLFERGLDVRHLCRDLIPDEYSALLPALPQPQPQPQQQQPQQQQQDAEQLLPAATATATATTTTATAAVPGQITVTFVTEKDLHAPQGFFSVFRNSLSQTLGGTETGKRKLLVRKDISVARLSEAVEQFFKIPASMLRLYALHYFADVQQERFEVMADVRSVASYLSQHPVPGNFAPASPTLVVLVTRRPPAPDAPSSAAAAAQQISLWVKYLDAQSLDLVSGGLLTVDVSQPFSNYFATVEKKFPTVRAPPSSSSSGGGLAVFEEFGPRLVEKKREKFPIADENLTDGDVVIFADLAVLARPKLPLKDAAQVSVSASRSASASASAVSWVEQLLPLFLKRKTKQTALSSQTGGAAAAQQEQEPGASGSHQQHLQQHLQQLQYRESSSKRSRFLDVLLNEAEAGEEDDAEETSSSSEDDEDDENDESAGAAAAAGGGRATQDAAGETEISRQRLLRYLREAHRSLKLEISDHQHKQQSGCFLCGGAGDSAAVSLVCSERCVPEQISVHLLCLADLMGDGRPLDCVLTPNCPGHLESGNFFKKKSSPPPPVPVTAPEPDLSLAKISDSLRTRFLAACAPPLAAPKKQPPKALVLAPLPAFASAAAATAAAASETKKSRKKEASELDKQLWWEACQSSWGGDTETAHEFILAAEVSGDRQTQPSDDAAAFIFFHWKNLLLSAVAAQPSQPPQLQPQPAAAKAKAQPQKKAKNAKPEVVDQQVAPAAAPAASPQSTATNTPQSVAAPLESVEWQPVQRQKTPKEKRPTSSQQPPTVQTGTPVRTPPAKKEKETNWTATVKKAVEMGGWEAEEPSAAPTSEGGNVETERGEMLPDHLRQFCLPGAIVFVFESPEYRKALPLTTLTALAPKLASPDDQVEALLGAAALCDAKVERAFAAPAKDDRVRWFVELETEAESLRVVEYMQQHLPLWDDQERGTLVTIA